MREGSVCLLVVMAAVVGLGGAELAQRTKVFLAEGESYLFFPHRHFHSISTYTSNCSAKPP